MSQASIPHPAPLANWYVFSGSFTAGLSTQVSMALQSASLRLRDFPLAGVTLNAYRTRLQAGQGVWGKSRGRLRNREKDGRTSALVSSYIS